MLESVSHLSLTIPIYYKGMFGGLWGRWGARSEAAQLAGEQDGNTWLPSLAAAGAAATPQPSDWAEGLGDGGEGFGESAVCGKVESWQSKLAYALQNVILALLPPSFHIPASQSTSQGAGTMPKEPNQKENRASGTSAKGSLVLCL